MIVTVRFEEEILTSQKIDDVYGNNSAGSEVTNGSSAFDQIHVQRNNQPPHAPQQAAEVKTSNQKPENSTIKQRLTFSGVDYSSITVDYVFASIIRFLDNREPSMKTTLNNMYYKYRYPLR